MRWFGFLLFGLTALFPPLLIAALLGAGLGIEAVVQHSGWPRFLVIGSLLAFFLIGLWYELKTKSVSS